MIPARQEANCFRALSWVVFHGETCSHLISIHEPERHWGRLASTGKPTHHLLQTAPGGSCPLPDPHRHCAHRGMPGPQPAFHCWSLGAVPGVLLRGTQPGPQTVNQRQLLSCGPTMPCPTQRGSLQSGRALTPRHEEWGALWSEASAHSQTGVLNVWFQEPESDLLPLTDLGCPGLVTTLYTASQRAELKSFILTM